MKSTKEKSFEYMKSIEKKDTHCEYDDVFNIPLGILPSTNLRKDKKKKRRRALFLFIVFSFFVLGITLFFSRSFLLERIFRDEIEVDDSDVRWRKVDVAKDENAYYDLIRLNDVFVISNEEREILEEMFYGSDVDEAIIQDLFLKHKDAISLFSQASQKLKYQNPRFFDPQMVTLSDYDDASLSIQNLENMTFLLSARSFLLIRDQKYDQAMEEALKPVRVAQLIEESQCATAEYLVAKSMKEIGLTVVRKIFFLAGIVDLDWKGYINEMQRYYRNEIALISACKSEYQMQSLAVDAVFQGNLGMIPSSVFEKDDSREALSEQVKNSFYFQPNRTKNSFAQSARLCIRDINTPCGKTNMLNTEQNILRQSAEKFIHGNSIGDLLIKTYPLHISSLLQKRCEEDMFVGASHLIGGIKHYFYEKGTLPQALEDLVPQYLEEIPSDPFDGQNFRYNEEKKIVYSVGRDTVDSHGEGIEGDLNSSDMVFSVGW